MVEPRSLWSDGGGGGAYGPAYSSSKFLDNFYNKYDNNTVAARPSASSIPNLSVIGRSFSSMDQQKYKVIWEALTFRLHWYFSSGDSERFTSRCKYSGRQNIYSSDGVQNNVSFGNKRLNNDNFERQQSGSKGFSGANGDMGRPMSSYQNHNSSKSVQLLRCVSTNVHRCTYVSILHYDYRAILIQML